MTRGSQRHDDTHPGCHCARPRRCWPAGGSHPPGRTSVSDLAGGNGFGGYSTLFNQRQEVRYPVKIIPWGWAK